MAEGGVLFQRRVQRGGDGVGGRVGGGAGSEGAGKEGVARRRGFRWVLNWLDREGRGVTRPAAPLADEIVATLLLLGVQLRDHLVLTIDAERRELPEFQGPAGVRGGGRIGSTEPPLARFAKRRVSVCKRASLFIRPPPKEKLRLPPP